MSDPSGQSPPEGEEGDAKDPGFRDDALSELMTGAYAATSMVTMGGEGDLPAPPVWAPTDDAPSAEALDGASGAPTQIPSGPHRKAEAEIEIDADFDELEPAADVVEPRSTDAETLPLSGPLGIGPLGPPSVDMPISSDDYPAHLGYVDEDDDGEGAASISTDSGVVVTPQHAQGARLTGAYPTVASQLRSPSPKRQPSSMPWIIGGAVLVGLVAVGAIVTMSGGDAGDDAPAADVQDPPPGPSQAALAPTPAAAQPGPTPTDTPAPSPTEAPPPAAAVKDPGTSAPSPAPGDPKQAYAAALAQYEADPNNPGLLELTLTACTLGLGPEARTAFHKLVGGKSRSKAVVKCRDAGIDVTSKVAGYTGPEIANQARAALDDGRADDALALAKQSNRTERNHVALAVMVLAHCELKQKKSAKKLLRHVPEKHRAELIRDCGERGVKLRR